MNKSRKSAKKMGFECLFDIWNKAEGGDRKNLIKILRESY